MSRASGPTPPRWLERFVEWCLPAGLSGQSALGDLAEQYARRAESGSRLGAGFWYGAQAFSIATHRAVRDPGGSPTGQNTDLGMDVRWSIRSITRHPGATLGIVAVLGLGLGANVAVFSVVDGTLGDSSGWKDPDRTVAVWPDNPFSLGQIDLYGREQVAYRTLGGYLELAFALGRPDGESESVNGVMITPGLFSELGRQPVLGRALSEEDGQLGAEPVVVLGHALWQRSFGGRLDVIGTRVDIGGSPVTVVGVQAPGFTAPGGRAELWLPVIPDPRDDDFWKAQSYSTIGALRDGASLDDAQGDLMAFTDLLSDMFPMFYKRDFARGLATVTLADEEQRRLISTPLILLLVGTGLLMLVTALNVGNLLLGRSMERQRELSIRAALGAGRRRIVRQLLVEGLSYTVLAVVLGLVLAVAGGDWIASLFVEQAVVRVSPVTSPAVLLYATTLAGLAWLVLNGVPVFHFLKGGGGLLAKSAPRSGGRSALVSAQAALATLLLVSASLLIATVGNLRDVPLGFSPDGILTVELSTPQDRVATPSEARDLYDALAAGVGGVPGVTEVGLTGWLPMRRQAPPTPINLESDPKDPREALRAPMEMVDPGFFDVLGVRSSSGRLLDATDRAELPGAIVVNETLAGMLWPGGNAVGQRIAVDPHDWMRWIPVVGVVPDVRGGSIRGPVGPALYVALAESPSRDVTLMLRTDQPVQTVAAQVRQAITTVDPLVPIRNVSTMQDVVRAAYSTSWVMMGLLTVLAFLATTLGAVGIYAVLTQHVAATKREIGVRMALGAKPRALIGSVVRSGLALSGVGIVVGSVLAAVSGRFIDSLLYEVSSLSPWAFIAPAAALGVAATLAAWVPAARAGRLPPADVLKGE